MQDKVDRMIAGMTLEEKASMCSGLDCWHTKALPDKGIPSIRMCDGPSGLRFQSDQDDHIGVHASIEMVSYPTGCAMASSFDRNLMRRVGEAIGKEGRSVGVSLVLGPASNIKRHPLCGRNFEYLSEDPYLTGEMSAAEIDGIQSQQVGACMKHYACNNQETWRMKVSANVDERILREMYLAGFERAVKKSQPCALMSSYNRVNGQSASENKKLLTSILRDEWDFEGFVVSDWGAVNDRAACLEAGLDMEMPGSNGITDRQLVAAVQNGQLDEAILDKAVRRVLLQVLRYAQKPTGEDFERESHHALAVEAAKESAVLLQNKEGVLPLQHGTKVALIGRFAENPRFQGGGSACVNPFRLTNPWEEARGIAGTVYVPGFTEKGDEANPEWKREAVEAAKQADVAVIFAGLPETFESECYDRPDMKLPACQNEVIASVCEVQKNVVVVLCSGSPVEMPWAEQVQAILQMHTGGQGVGAAAVQLLYGQANPCGKLAETYPLRLEDTPAYLFYPGDGKEAAYQEGIFVGYRYYDQKKMDVLFPFGHGLSYTAFGYGNMRLSQASLTEKDTVQVMVDITNTGRMPGKEAVQLYVEDRSHLHQEEWTVNQQAQVYVQEQEGHVVRPQKELKGFEKVSLQPGETKTVTMELDRRSFAWYDVETASWRCNNGMYRIHVGASSRDIRLAADIHMQAEAVVSEAPFAMDTLMSEISPVPALWDFTLDYLAEACPKLDEIIHGTDATSMYLREELKELPLYAVRGIYAVEQDKLEKLIDTLNEMRF